MAVLQLCYSVVKESKQHTANNKRKIKDRYKQTANRRQKTEDLIDESEGGGVTARLETDSREQTTRC
jgi:hypothetical protein